MSNDIELVKLLAEKISLLQEQERTEKRILEISQQIKDIEEYEKHIEEDISESLNSKLQTCSEVARRLYCLGFEVKYDRLHKILYFTKDGERFGEGILTTTPSLFLENKDSYNTQFFSDIVLKVFVLDKIESFLKPTQSVKLTEMSKLILKERLLGTEKIVLPYESATMFFKLDPHAPGKATIEIDFKPEDFLEETPSENLKKKLNYAQRTLEEAKKYHQNKLIRGN